MVGTPGHARSAISAAVTAPRAGKAAYSARRSLPVALITAIVPQDCMLAMPKAAATCSRDRPIRCAHAAVAQYTPITVEKFQSLRQPTFGNQAVEQVLPDRHGRDHVAPRHGALPRGLPLGHREHRRQDRAARCWPQGVWSS